MPTAYRGKCAHDAEHLRHRRHGDIGIASGAMSVDPAGSMRFCRSGFSRDHTEPEIAAEAAPTGLATPVTPVSRPTHPRVRITGIDPTCSRGVAKGPRGA